MCSSSFSFSERIFRCFSESFPKADMVDCDKLLKNLSNGFVVFLLFKLKQVSLTLLPAPAKKKYMRSNLMLKLLYLLY